MKDQKSWKAGVITSLAVIAACTLLVLTAKGFNRMMIEERCDSDMCHLQPWWAQGLEQTPTEIPTPISSTSPSSMTTDSPHMQLKRASNTTEGTAETAVTEIQPCEAASCNDTQSDEQGREMVQENTETVTQDDGSKPEPAMDKAEPEEVETQFGCLVNGDCGLGYECFEGRCRPGCSKHQDCPSGYECRYGRWGHRCFEKTGWHRECREHLRFCTRHGQCCSGYCGRGRGGVLMCRKVVDDV